MNQLLSLLESVLGSGKVLKGSEVVFHCPFCHHHREKLAVNVSSGKWHCWVCNSNGRRLLSLFRKLHVSKDQIRQLATLLKDDLDYIESDTTDAVLALPQEFESLTTPSTDYQYLHAMKYLKDREVTAGDILKHQLGYCKSGLFQGRIIIPSYDKEGKLNFFVSRTYYPDNPMHYKNPPVTKNVVGFEFQISWSQEVVICEGVFDAMAIKRNAIPLFGKTISSKLEREIVVNNVRDIYLSLDRDALRNTIKIAEKFMKEGRNVYVIDLDDKDPSKLGFARMVELKKKAPRMTFADLISLKLSLI